MNGMMGGLDPQMMQMLMQGMGGGQQMGGGMQNIGMGQPELLQPQQYQPPQTANLGFPTMPGQQQTPGLQPGAANQKMAGMGDQFGQGWQGAPGQPAQQQGWWDKNQGNVSNALWALQGMI